MRLILLLGFCIIAATSSFCSTDWTGAVSSDWNTPGNWNPGVPTGTDDVVITNTGFAPEILTGAFSAQSLTITNQTLSLKPGTQLTVSNTVAVNAGASIVMETTGRLVLSTATLTTIGNLVGGVRLNGVCTVNFDGAGTQTGDMRLEPDSSGSNIAATGIPAIASAGTLTIEPASGTISLSLTSSFTCDGVFNLVGNAGADMNLDLNGANTLTINGAMNINAAAGGEGQISGTGTLTNSATGTLNINGATDNVPIACGTFNNQGQLNVVTGVTAFNTTATNSGTLAVAGGAICRLSATTTLTSTGNMTGRLRPTNGSSIAFNGNGTQTGNLRIEPEASAFSLLGSGNPAIAASATLTIEPASGTISFNLTTSFLCNGIFNLVGNAGADTAMDINGGSTLTINGTMNITAAAGGEGQVVGAGNLAISASGTLNVAGASDNVPLNCANLSNAGALNLTAGVAILNTAATNSGTIDVAPAAMVRLGGTASLTSTGDISGRLRPTTGSVIAFDGNGTQTSDVRIEPEASGAALSGNGLPAIAGGATLTIEPPIGTVSLNLTSSFTCDGVFNLVGNAGADMNLNINGANTLTINGTMNINAASTGEGQISGTGTLTNSGTGTLNINGATDNVPIACGNVNNLGQLNVVTGVTAFNTTANNSGTLTIAAVATGRLSATTALTSTGNMTGRLRPTNGSSIAFNGNGTQTGILRIEPEASAFSLLGSGNPAIAASATLTIEPASGTISFNLTSSFVCNGIFNLVGNAGADTAMDINGGSTLTINGTMNISAAAGGEGQVVGAGNLAISASGTLIIAGASDNVPLNSANLNNAGALNLTAGVAILNTAATNSGTIDVAPAAMVRLGGTASLTSTGDISGRLRPTTGSVIAFDGNGTQTSDVRIEPEASGAALSGNGLPAIAGGATLTIEPAAGTISLNLTSSFRCNGMFNLVGNAGADMNLNINGANTLTINGTMNINAAAGGEGQITGTGTLTNSATGTLNINGATDNVPLACGNVNNLGQLNVVTGVTAFNTIATNSGTLAVAAGAICRLSGATALTSTGNMTGRLRPTNGSSIAFNGNGTQTGILRIEPEASAFSLLGSGNPAIAASATLTIEPAAGTISFNLTTSFLCNGIFNLVGNAGADTAMDINGGSTLTINGTMNINAAAGGEGQIIGGGSLALGAGATLNSNGASDAIPIACSSLTSSGTLSANTGVVNITTFTQAAGRTILNGGTVRIGGGTGTATYNGGTLEGAGTFDGNLTNNGATIKPGAPLGTLLVDGNLTQAAGTAVEIELGGTTAGTTFDVLAVNGAATLNGTLRGRLINGFIPALNVDFQVLTFTSRTANFATFDTTNAAQLRYFIPTISATDLKLRSRSIPSLSSPMLVTNENEGLNATAMLSDPDGDVNTVSIVTNGSKGAAVVTNTATGAFTYTPGAGQFGFDTIVFKSNDGLVDSAPLTIQIKILPLLKPALSIDVSQNPTRQNNSVTFTAVGSDPNGLPLSYSWNFGDATPAETTTPVTHTFTAGGDFTVVLTADNGLETFTATLPMTVFTPNSGGEGVINISDGKPAVENPLNGITISVAASDGGVIELAIDVNALNRAAFNIETTFDNINSRVATRTGPRPVCKFVNPGLYVATATATDVATGEDKGKMRKTIGIGSAEVGNEPDFTAPPDLVIIEPAAVKGKFVFNTAKADEVTFVGSVELPEGVDLTQDQSLSIAIGNVIDELQISRKGKPLLPSTADRVKKAMLKLPRPKKGTTLTTKGQIAKLTVTFKSANLSDAGFDTEGITDQLRGDETDLKSVPRKIQLALMLNGVVYESLLDVEYKLSKTADSGQFLTRSK